MRGFLRDVRFSLIEVVINRGSLNVIHLFVWRFIKTYKYNLHNNGRNVVHAISYADTEKCGSVDHSPIPCTRKVSAGGSSLFKTVTKLWCLYSFVLPRLDGGQRIGVSNTAHWSSSRLQRPRKPPSLPYCSCWYWILTTSPSLNESYGTITKVLHKRQKNYNVDRLCRRGG